MRILVSGSIRMVARLAPHWPDHLGLILQPKGGNTAAAASKIGLPFACDNGAYSGFDAALFRKRLARVAGQPGLLWVVAPDVVADAGATFTQFWTWLGELQWKYRVLIALVGQDGAEDEDIPWGLFRCWFVGGSTRWKLSRASADLVAEAKLRGKLVHMGRVNSLRRLRLAHSWGCDSVDGSAYSRFHHRTITHRPDMSLERHLRFLKSLEEESRVQGSFTW